MTQPDPLPAHRNLIVWQRSVQLARECGRFEKRLPPSERFELALQLHRACASVHANIAEGAGRRTPAEFARFLAIARGSAMEVDSHIAYAIEMGLLAAGEVASAQQLAVEVIRMLSAMLGRLRPL